jgi:hypothetical protein
VRLNAVEMICWNFFWQQLVDETNFLESSGFEQHAARTVSTILVTK